MMHYLCSERFFFCIMPKFIGHGGSRTAEYLKTNLFKNVISHPDFIKDTKSALGMKFGTFMCIL